MILPFKISNKRAEKHMYNFIKKNSFFADSKFLYNFTLDNIYGVFMPYYVIDINAKAKFVCKGEINKSSYTVSDVQYYAAESYDLVRNFDI